MQTKTILVTTYAINPYKGSEDGMGWNFILQIARHHKVYAITRENNKAKIDKYIQENPSELYANITFLYFDLPYWMRFWKKGGRGALLYYWMWQKGIVNFIKKQTIEFDIVHNLNFHNDWTPSYLWKLNKPFVWGPIGHHPTIPSKYMKYYSYKENIKNKLTWWTKIYFWKFSISLNKTLRNATHIICMNSSVVQVLPGLKNKYTIMPSVASEDFGWNNTIHENKFKLISAGRLVPLKGFDLTIRSFSHFLQNISENEKSNIILRIIGSGPELNNLKTLCDKLNINEYVEFIPWIERNDLIQEYQSSSIFIFPSHEGAGMVISEALSFGLPIICLDNFGPGEFINETCGFKIKSNSYEDTIMQLAESINNLYTNKQLVNSMRQSARDNYLLNFKWDNRGDKLRDIYEKL